GECLPRLSRQRGVSQELRERVSPPFADTKKPTVAFGTRSAVEIDEAQIRRMPGRLRLTFRLTRSRIEQALTSAGRSQHEPLEALRQLVRTAHATGRNARADRCRLNGELTVSRRARPRDC